MRLLPYMNSFRDELTKIAQVKKAKASSGALMGGLLGAGITGGHRGALIGAGLGGIVGGAASLGQKLMEPSQAQLLAAQQQGWEPAGYVPSYMRAGF